MKTLLLFDANSIIHRCYHALPPLNSPSGKPIQSIYGISSILLKIIKEEKPEYAASCFDRPEPTFRKEKYAEYKAQRPKAPDELISQIIEAHDLFAQFGIKTFEKAGFEADDIIASMVKRFKKEKDLRIMVLTGDKDTLQLVEDEHIVVRTFGKGISETIIYDEEEVKRKFGLEPKQLIDYKALVGDPSDNVKGVPGVGPKTATELIKQYGTIEKLFENLGKDEKARKKLEAYRGEAELSKMLVTLEQNVPVELGELEELNFKPDKENIALYFSAMGFDTLKRRLEANEEGSRTKKENKKESGGQAAMF